MFETEKNEIRSTRENKAPEVSPNGQVEKINAEDIEIAELAEFDKEYFYSISKDGKEEWIAFGMENCKNQRYYTVIGDGGVKLGIIGVYDTENEQNITHIVIDPKFRGKGLLSKFYDQLLEKENLSFLIATINIDNIASVKSHEKAGYEKISDKEYEEQFHKYKYILMKN